MTVMGDAWMDRLSDAGSIPARSILLSEGKRLFIGVSRFFVFFDLSTLEYN